MDPHKPSATPALTGSTSKGTLLVATHYKLYSTQIGGWTIGTGASMHMASVQDWFSFLFSSYQSIMTGASIILSRVRGWTHRNLSFI